MRKILCVLGTLLALSVVPSINTEAASVGKPVNVKQSGHSTDWVSVTWDDLHNSDGWEYQVSKDGTTWKSENSYCYQGMHLSNIEAGTSIWFKVRGIDKDSYGKVVSYGAWSDSVELVTSPDVKVSGVKSSSHTNTGFTLSWKPVKGANTYKVKVSDKEYYTNKNTIKIGKLAKNKNYSAYICAGRASNSYKAYQVWGVDFAAPVKPLTISKFEVSEFYRSDDGKMNVNVIKPKYNYGYSSTLAELELWTSYGKPKRLKTFNNKYISSMSISHSQLAKKCNKLLKVRIRYRVSDSNKKYISGNWSDWKYIVNRVNYNKSKFKNGKLTVSWKKITGAKGYKVYACNKLDGKYKLVKTTGSNSYTTSKVIGGKVRKGKSYYFKVIPYVVVKGKKINVSTLNEVLSVYL